MKVSTFQFGLCISLAFHAALGGVIVFGGLGRRGELLPASEREQIVTVTFVAAPDEAPGEAPSQPAQVVAIAPAIETQSKATEPIVTEVKPAPSPILEPPVQVPPPTPQPQPAALIETETPASPAAIESPKPAPVLSPTASIPAASSSSAGGDNSKRSGDASAIRPAVPGIRARPAYLKNPEPTYPMSARRRQQEGLVLLKVRVNAQGRATRVELKQSSGFAVLDDAAIQAARGWEFSPARIGSTTVEDEAEVPVRFKLTP